MATVRSGRFRDSQRVSRADYMGSVSYCRVRNRRSIARIGRVRSTDHRTVRDHDLISGHARSTAARGNGVGYDRNIAGDSCPAGSRGTGGIGSDRAIAYAAKVGRVGGNPIHHDGGVDHRTNVRSMHRARVQHGSAV